MFILTYAEYVRKLIGTMHLGVSFIRRYILHRLHVSKEAAKLLQCRQYLNFKNLEG